jgi:hypothetical protein
VDKNRYLSINIYGWGIVVDFGAFTVSALFRIAVLEFGGIVVRRICLSFTVILPIIIAASSVYADQTSVERMLKENKGYIEFINVSITNLGGAENEEYFDVCEMQFNADVAFLQSDYGRAFKYIYGSQKKQIPLFQGILTRYYLDEAKAILDKIAPNVIKSKNAKARSYLTFGYRDRAVCRNYLTIADASHPRLYSDKLFKYSEAIKIARRSIRYAFLALFESRDIETKKYIYNRLLEIERENGNAFYTRFLSKTGEAFNVELVLTFDDYEKRPQKETTEKKTKTEDSTSTDKKTADAKGADKKTADAKGTDQKTTDKNVPPQPVFEKKVEREVRFRQERRVAEYLRDAEFDKAEDILVKYVDDFNFKLIQAAIEVVSTKEKELLGIDFERAKIHHTDNFTRLAKPSLTDSFSGRLKVRDDIAKEADQNGGAKSQGGKKPDGVKPKEDAKIKPGEKTDEKQADIKNKSDVKEEDKKKSPVK